jgi:8-oxo-dGTP pyrophosphatase MutT (NUDIX family)
MVHRDLTAAGILFYSQSTNRRLFLLRASRKNREMWGLVGGKMEEGETLHEGMLRECQEEIGFIPDIIKTIPIEKFTSPDGHFQFHTFIGVVEEEFVPKLNQEHIGYAWIDSGIWPSPLHPGLRSTVNFREIIAKIDWIGDNLLSPNKEHI